MLEFGKLLKHTNLVVAIHHGRCALRTLYFPHVANAAV